MRQTRDWEGCPQGAQPDSGQAGLPGTEARQAETLSAQSRPGTATAPGLANKHVGHQLNLDFRQTMN